jgi:decaprenylphospho-beta-D-ribofuranose 2-oxidase
MTPISGWGLTPSSTPKATVYPSTQAEAIAVLQSCDRVVPRGLGRSYGDAAILHGGTVIDLTHLKDRFELDIGSGLLTVSAGYSLAEINARIIERGWFLPVTPGTQYVTVAGAFASDVHGKNHHRDGSMSKHTEALNLATRVGLKRFTPKDRAFFATAGGMGLTGLITELTLQLIPIETSYMRVETIATSNLSETFETMEKDANFRYAVAWLDATASAGRLGRGILTFADHATVDDLEGKAISRPLVYRNRQLASVPFFAPHKLLNNYSIAAFNDFYYLANRRNAGVSLQPITKYFYPLDAVGNWNRLYGKRGFLQYQIVVPYGAEQVIENVLADLSRHGHPSFLSVLKRFGDFPTGPLGFPMSGWTLALDLPARRAGLEELLLRLDYQVVEAGGRVYLTKDSRLDPKVLPLMYPRIEEFRAIKSELDPTHVFSSDLAERLHLTGERR